MVGFHITQKVATINLLVVVIFEVIEQIDSSVIIPIATVFLVTCF